MILQLSFTVVKINDHTPLLLRISLEDSKERGRGRVKVLGIPGDKRGLLKWVNAKKP